jgi:hypothetical protein
VRNAGFEGFEAGHICHALVIAQRGQLRQPGAR